ncbi:macrocin O-methyltransferase [Actinomadura craniellae]|uniref:Macrocin O-methyltransferase n=1 Tax=Actinomadura craniellae TaxID=2231787 RepID=A0A365H0V4_9ACTN|nr:TylF/MycF family methyltransferase [Actinomadura craniellae]RAY12707.1 macrocin O-methyltransferase [Actinomadura craniellae]
MTVPRSGADHYLGLLKKVLTNVIYEDDRFPHWGLPDPGYEREARVTGFDWPTVAHTMVGLARLDNVQECLESVLADGVPGDFVETGVWRGGTCILARGVLSVHGVTDRTVWVVDSFEGIPTTDEGSNSLDQEMKLHEHNDVLAVPMKEVERNFERYGLLDDQVRFLPGWFKDTLPDAPIERVAVLRLDGDLYESTMDSLTHLYPKLSVGGYVIVDDYILPACAQAVHDFRERHGIEDELTPIDQVACYWRRSA